MQEQVEWDQFKLEETFQLPQKHWTSHVLLGIDYKQAQ
jgi:hypothetical protein